MERFWLAVGSVVVENKSDKEGIWLSTRQVPSFVIDTQICGATNEDGVKRRARSIIMTATSGNINSVSVHVEPLVIDEGTLIDMLAEVRAKTQAEVGPPKGPRKSMAMMADMALMSMLFERHGIATTMLPYSTGRHYEIAFTLTTDHKAVDEIFEDFEINGTGSSVLMFTKSPQFGTSRRLPAWVLVDDNGNQYDCEVERVPGTHWVTTVSQWVADTMKSKEWNAQRVEVASPRST